MTVTWWRDPSVVEIGVLLYSANESLAKRVHKKQTLQSTRKVGSFNEILDKENVLASDQHSVSLIGSASTMNHDVRKATFTNIHHLNRYLVELWGKVEEDTEDTLIASQYFDCPMPTPEWCDTSRQWRTGSSVGLAWRRPPVDAL